MRRAIVPFILAATLGTVAWPAARSGDAEDVCARVTDERLLEEPAIAQQWAAALRSGDADAIAWMEHALREIRAAHGCGGDAASSGLPDRSDLPAGHPPVGRPLDGRGMLRAPLFGAPEAVTI